MKVCVFCENCIVEKGEEDYYGGYTCKVHLNKKVVDPIMGTPTYMILERDKRYSDDNEEKIEGYDPDRPFGCCSHYNLNGDCPDFSRIGVEEEKILCPSKIEDEEFEHFIKVDCEK